MPSGFNPSKKIRCPACDRTDQAQYFANTIFDVEWGDKVISVCCDFECTCGWPPEGTSEDTDSTFVTRKAKRYIFDEQRYSMKKNKRVHSSQH